MTSELGRTLRAHGAATEPSPPAGGPRALQVSAASLAIHGAALWAAAMWVPARPAPAVSPPGLTEIDVVVPERPARPPAAPAGVPPDRHPVAAAAGAGVHGHASRGGQHRSLSRAPAEANPYADLTLSYDRPAGPDPEPGDGTAVTALGAALAGTGLGAGGVGYGLGDGLQIPPPPASHARPPRPRRYYASWKFHDVRMLVGETVQADLMIDPRGLVRDVRILRHVNPWVDQQATRLAHWFVFYPALDDAGEPVAGSFRWTFQIISD